MALSASRAVLLPSTLLVFAASAAPAAATHYQDHLQVQVFAPPRVYEHTNTLPMEVFESTRPKARFRVGGHTHRVFWNNTVIGGYTTTAALRAMRRSGQQLTAVFADRRLTAAERRRFREVTALYDDADVMVLAEGHPACRGLTQAQARGIVSGRFTRWSQIVTGAARDAISVRYRKAGDLGDLRFGARYVRRSGGRYSISYPAGSRGSSDGGLSAAAAGDQSVAAVTGWSRFRPQPGVCAVPLGGVAPSNATVADRSYPEAFRVSYVVPRRRVRYGLNRQADAVVQAFMKSARAKDHLAQRGLLVVGRPAPARPGGTAVAAPATDHAGRPITTSADAGAEQALTGLRLTSHATPDGSHRLVFDPEGTLRRLVFDPSGACISESRGGWTVKGGWRFAEHGGGLIARIGWFLGDPDTERTIELPDAEPQTAYLDGAPYVRDPGASTVCGPA